MALRQRLVDGEAAGELKGHVGGIHRVIRPVDQLGADVDHGKAKRPVLQPLDDALLHRRDVVAGHYAPLDLLGESEPGAARQRLYVKHDIAVLAVTARTVSCGVRAA